MRAAEAGPTIKLNTSSAPTTGSATISANARIIKNIRSIRPGAIARARANSGDTALSKSGRNSINVAPAASALSPAIGQIAARLTPKTCPNNSASTICA